MILIDFPTTMEMPVSTKAAEAHSLEHPSPVELGMNVSGKAGKTEDADINLINSTPYRGWNISAQEEAIVRRTDQMCK